MSIILANYNKKKKPKLTVDGYIQSLPPDNDLPTSWAAHDNRIYCEKRRLGEITEWTNEDGDRTHFTEKKIIKGKKQLFPFTYWTKTINGKLIGVWKTLGWKGKKCFHKSNKIAQSDLPLLIPEGEKCMHFAENNSFLSKHYLPTTWWGGVEQLPGFNFEIFKDKEVLLCPDNDLPGRKAMHRIAYQLVTNGITENIKYLNIAEKFSEQFPSAWDIADGFPDKYKLENILEPGSMFIADYKDVKDDKIWKEIEKEEEQKAEEEAAEKLLTSYCYVMANDMFNKLGSADFYKSEQLNNFHKHQIKKGSLTNLLLTNPKFARAETFVTSAKYKPGLINITKPGMIPLIQKGIVLNIYIPNNVMELKGDVQFLIDFFIWLIGKDKWMIIEQWIAYHLQHPGEKIKWAIVLVSAIEGVGKGLLARIISRVLGFDNVNENANYKHLTNTHNTLLIGTQVVVLNEVSLGDFKSKAEGTNSLKNFVADDYYSCNFKGKTMVKLPNLTNFMLFSNDETVIKVNQGARRYFFCNLDKTEEDILDKTNEGFFKKAWDFVDSDKGAAALIHYFHRDVDIPKPEMFKARAPETEDLKELIEKTKHPVIKKLEWDLNRQDGQNKIFREHFCGLISFDELNDKLNTKEKFDSMSIQFDWGSWSDDALYKFLSSNCTRWNNGDATRQISINGTKYRMYLLRDHLCPIPNKSYKDLTPKQIEIIHGNYMRVYNEIKNEEKDYYEAKEKLPEEIKFFKDLYVKGWVEDSNNPNRSKYQKAYKKFKNKTVDQAYEIIMDGQIDLGNNQEHEIRRIKIYQFKIARGIRTPEQIIADIPLGDPEHQIKNLGRFTPKIKFDDDKIHAEHMHEKKVKEVSL